jgi:hypothetical protein
MSKKNHVQSPADVHPAQENSVLAIHIHRVVLMMMVMQVVERGRLMYVRSGGSVEFRLYGIVVLLVDDVVDGVAVNQQVLHRVTQVLGRIVRDVQELAVLRQHHEKARECLKHRQD